MAQPIDFPDRNDFIGKPPDMTDDQCLALPVCRMLTYIPGETKDSEPVQVAAHVSCWQLSEEEKAAVLQTGKVYVKILGHTLFPMSVEGIKPIHPGAEQYADVVPAINRN